MLVVGLLSQPTPVRGLECGNEAYRIIALQHGDDEINSNCEKLLYGLSMSKGHIADYLCPCLSQIDKAHFEGLEECHLHEMDVGVLAQRNECLEREKVPEEDSQSEEGQECGSDVRASLLSSQRDADGQAACSRALGTVHSANWGAPCWILTTACAAVFAGAGAFTSESQCVAAQDNVRDICMNIYNEYLFLESCTKALSAVFEAGCKVAVAGGSAFGAAECSKLVGCGATQRRLEEDRCACLAGAGDTVMHLDCTLNGQKAPHVLESCAAKPVKSDDCSTDDLIRCIAAAPPEAVVCASVCLKIRGEGNGLKDCVADCYKDVGQCDRCTCTMLDRMGVKNCDY